MKNKKVGVIQLIFSLTLLLVSPILPQTNELNKDWKSYIINIYPQIKFISEPDEYISGTPPGMPESIVQRLKEADEDYKGGYYYRIVVERGHRNDFVYVELMHFTGNENLDLDIFSYKKIDPVEYFLPPDRRASILWVEAVIWENPTIIKIVTDEGPYLLDISKLDFHYEVE